MVDCLVVDVQEERQAGKNKHIGALQPWTSASFG